MLTFVLFGLFLACWWLQGRNLRVLLSGEHQNRRTAGGWGDVRVKVICGPGQSCHLPAAQPQPFIAQSTPCTPEWRSRLGSAEHCGTGGRTLRTVRTERRVQ